MERDFDVEIRELIKKVLPSQTADELRKALDEFAKLRGDYKKLRDELDEAKGSRGILEKRHKSLEAEFEMYKKEHGDLTKIRAELAEQKEALRVQAYEIKLEKTEMVLGVVDQHRKAMEAFMLNMSRNSVFRKTTLTEKSYVVPPTPGLAGEYSVQREPVDGFVETKEDKTEETIEEE